MAESILYDFPARETNPNGRFPTSREGLEKVLTGEPLTQGYKPTLPMWALWASETVPQFYLLRDIELMMIHPIVRNDLNYFKAGIAGAEFWGGPSPDGNPDGIPICPENPEVEKFVHEHVQRYWDRGVPKIQGGYEYGWIGCESLYEKEDGKLAWRDLVQFSPRDVYLLTRDNNPVGVRVKQVQGRQESYSELRGMIDLWMASKDVPAKGIWYVHEPRYNSWYGQSQLLGAWRTWRRLAWKDGGETVLDGACYRGAYSGPVVGYPEEDMQVASNAPATALDSQGNPRRYARDVARQMAEQIKAGAGVGLPTTSYPPEMGGKEKWTYKPTETKINFSALLEVIKYYRDEIAYGIGVPPELLAADMSSGGYSGRAIPMEAFLAQQQRIADALLWLFVEQILRPLVRWNFGDVRWSVKVQPLLITRRRQQAEGGKPKSSGMEPPGGLTMPGQHQGASHHPLEGQAPPPGQRDMGGASPSPYGNAVTGWAGSLNPLVTDQIREIARRVNALSRRAA